MLKIAKGIAVFGWFLFFCQLGQVASASQSGSYWIERIEGRPTTVEVLRNGKRIQLPEKTELRNADTIFSKAGQSIEIVTDDETKLVLAGEGKLEVALDPSAFKTVRLGAGKLLGWVKTKIRKGEDEITARRYRFLVRTPSAVMGIRGTQFVVESDDVNGKDKSTFRVLEGVVDIASNLKDLVTENFVVVKTGELVAFASGLAGEGVGTVAKVSKGVTVGVTNTVDQGVQTFSSKVMPFDVLGFVADLNQKLPEVFHVPFLTRKERDYSEEESRYHLSSFEFIWQGFFTRTHIPENVPSFGIGLSWNPTYHLVPQKYDLRLHVGNPRLFRGGHGLFSDLEFKVLGTAILKEAGFLEAGPMFRHFNDYGNGYGLSAGGGVWFMDRRIFHIIDRFFFGVNLLSSPYRDYSQGSRTLIWEYRAGIGITVF